MGTMFEDLIYPEGRIEPHTYTTLRPVCDAIAAIEPWMGGTPVPYVAVFFSKHTRLHFGQNDPGERYLLNFLGACKVLLESHIPFDIVTDRGLTAKDLSRYRALVLPNAACLDDVQNEAVRNYVESGGGLVSTWTNFFTFRLQRSKCFAMTRHSDHDPTLIDQALNNHLPHSTSRTDNYCLFILFASHSIDFRLSLAATSAHGSTC